MGNPSEDALKEECRADAQREWALRDTAAVAVMSAIYGNSDAPRSLAPWHVPPQEEQEVMDKIARIAWRQADALIRARRRRTT